MQPYFFTGTDKMWNLCRGLNIHHLYIVHVPVCNISYLNLLSFGDIFSLSANQNQKQSMVAIFFCWIKIK
jgi:hypothetical protein